MRYWPMAVVLDENQKPTKLFTYDSLPSIMECRKVFMSWERDYKILVVWVCNEDNRIVFFRSCVDVFNRITKFSELSYDGETYDET